MQISANLPRRYLKLVAALSGVLLALTACSSGASEKPGAEADPVATGPVNEAAAALLPSELREGGKITVGTNGPYAPMVMLGENGTDLTGVEIELFDSIAAGLGLTVEYSLGNWDGLLPGLSSKRYDALIASIADRPDRRAAVDFVNYAETGYAAVVPKGRATEFEEHADLCGKKVSFQTGSGVEDRARELSEQVCLAANLEAIMLQGFPDDNAGLLAVRSSRLDAHLMDSISAMHESQTDVGQKHYATVLTDLRGRVNPYGIAVHKESEGLRDAIQMQLQALMDSGRYLEIFEAYGIEAAALGDATVNAGE